MRCGLHHRRRCRRDPQRAPRAAAVSTARILPLLRLANIPLDALVSSANDPAERYSAGELAPEPRMVVRTDGGKGGTFVEAGTTHRYAAATAQVTGDTYGAGDTFAAGLAYALGRGLSSAEAIAEASRAQPRCSRGTARIRPDQRAPA